MRSALLVAALLLLTAPVASASATATELVCIGHRGVSYELDGTNSEVTVGPCDRDTIFDPVVEDVLRIVDDLLPILDL